MLAKNRTQINADLRWGHSLPAPPRLTPRGFYFWIPFVNKNSPFAKGRCEKIEIIPFTLPSPARGEGLNVEIEKGFPPLSSFYKGGFQRSGLFKDKNTGIFYGSHPL
jgi:hypothetical protein